MELLCLFHFIKERKGEAIELIKWSKMFDNKQRDIRTKEIDV